VFVPTNAQSNDLTAQVVDGTPAQAAGIRVGDVLLKIDEVDVTKWRTDPTVLPLSRFLARPAGTKLNLTLRREGEIFKITVTLRDILPSASSEPQSG
jgi:serine protease Do